MPCRGGNRFSVASFRGCYVRRPHGSGLYWQGLGQRLCAGYTSFLAFRAGNPIADRDALVTGMHPSMHAASSR